MSDPKSTLAALREGRTPPSLAEALKGSSPSDVLIELALDAAGGDDVRSVIDDYRAAGHDDDMPLVRQVYRTVLGTDWDLTRDLATAYALSTWGPAHAARLERGDGAAALVDDLDAIAEEAVALVGMRADYRRWQDEIGIHVLEGQALARLLGAAGSLEKTRVLEIGCEEGRLLSALAHHGADVLGVDIETNVSAFPVVVGDAMSVELPGPFDCVIAVAVFEWGSGWDPALAPLVLPRLHALLRPGGVAVVENVAIPLPFSDDAVRAAGFARLDTNVLMATSVPRSFGAQGGRGVALIRQ